VIENRDVGASTRLLRLSPVTHAGLSFLPGQFAWLITGRSPFSPQQHPLSFASSAETSPRENVIEFSIKALGDWSSNVVPRLTAGTRVWLDGPFGAFTPARKAAQGFVMIAGGIGIAPFRSMLLTMRDRRDGRQVVLFYAANDETRVLFADELQDLARTIDLTTVMVLEAPSPVWTGERGRIGVDVLQRHLPAQWRHFHFFICGPPAMTKAVEYALIALGVRTEAIDNERFTMG
jgi:predicted ferric reductase